MILPVPNSGSHPLLEDLSEVNHCHGPGRGHPCVGYSSGGSPSGPTHEPDPAFAKRARAERDSRRERSAAFLRSGKVTRAVPRSTGIELPEDPERYFVLDKQTYQVPLEDVETIRARPEGIANAEPHMRRAYDGTGGRRGPVTLQPKPGGGYTVLDGNSTVAIARKHGWKRIPAHVLTTPGQIAAFHKAEAEKKAAKAAKKAAALKAA